MQLALNGATIMHAPLCDDLEIAAEAGFSAPHVWAPKSTRISANARSG
jgi:hypothetical protein